MFGLDGIEAQGQVVEIWVLTIERGSGSETALKFSGDALYSLPCHTFLIFFYFLLLF